MNEPRIYGAWAGNPVGRKENVTRCIESVLGNERGAIAHQCDRKRGHGPKGLYCKQHDPEAVAARRKAITDKYNAKWAARDKEAEIRKAKDAVVEQGRAWKKWEPWPYLQGGGLLAHALDALDRLEHDEHCDAVDTQIKGKPCNCKVRES